MSHGDIRVFFHFYCRVGRGTIHWVELGILSGRDYWHPHLGSLLRVCSRFWRGPNFHVESPPKSILVAKSKWGCHLGRETGRRRVLTSICTISPLFINDFPCRKRKIRITICFGYVIFLFKRCCCI